MKTKRIAAGVLCAVLSLSMTTACSGTGGASENTQNTTAAAETAKPKEAELHTLFIRAPKKFSEITATFLNTASKETTDIEMKKESETDSAVTFSCEADVNLYNMVHIKSGETQIQHRDHRENLQDRYVCGTQNRQRHHENQTQISRRSMVGLFRKTVKGLSKGNL